MVEWASGTILTWIPAGFAIMVLAFLPIWILMFVFPALGRIIALSLAIEEDKVVEDSLGIDIKISFLYDYYLLT